MLSKVNLFKLEAWSVIYQVLNINHFGLTGSTCKDNLPWTDVYFQTNILLRKVRISKTEFNILKRISVVRLNSFFSHGKDLRKKGSSVINVGVTIYLHYIKSLL